MRVKSSLLLICIAVSLSLYAQKSPVDFLNKTYTVLIDTTSKVDFYRFYKLDFTYTFKNIGNHVVFIDSFPVRSISNRYITKPGAVTEMHFSHSDFFVNNSGTSKNKNCSSTLSLPFYYEGGIFTEDIKCNIVYGKGNLISVDTLIFDLTEKVKTIISKETIDSIKNTHPNLELTIFFTVMNNSDKVISCTKEMKCFWDNSPDSYSYDYIDLKPGETYDIPLTLFMAQRYFFDKPGYFIVKRENVSEVYTFSVCSKYGRRDK